MEYVKLFSFSNFGILYNLGTTEEFQMNTFPAGWRGRKEHKSLNDTEAVKSKHTGGR